MKTSEFDFELPQELTAQTPLAKRSASRLLVLHRSTGEIEHRHFYDIVDYLKPGDVLVRNNTRVIPARLFGTKEETGAHVELRYYGRKATSGNAWSATPKWSSWVPSSPLMKAS